MGDRAGATEAHEIVVALCDDAEELLSRAQPRLASAAALLEQARHHLDETDDARALTRRIDALQARTLLTAEHTPDEPGWHGWVIPGVFLAVAAWVVGAAMTFEPKNIARGATVTLSSQHTPGDPGQLVDGNVAEEAFQTKSETQPTAVIDLGRARDFHKIIVHRGEGTGPLAVEISLDGEIYGVYGTRKGHFKKWATEAPARARYIRISGRKRGPLRLNEVEIISP